MADNTTAVAESTGAPVTAVLKFFGYQPGPNGETAAAMFRSDWGKVPAEGKAQLRSGIGDGTLTYG